MRTFSPTPKPFRSAVGDIDLAQQRLDYGLTIDVQDGSLVVPLRIVGSWDQPELTIDGPALLDWLKGNPDVLSTIAGLWDLDQYLPEGASVASLQAEARAYIDAEATRILSEAQAFEQQIEQAVIDERERIAQAEQEAARARHRRAAGRSHAQLQAQQQAIEARARPRSGRPATSAGGRRQPKSACRTRQTARLKTASTPSGWGCSATETRVRVCSLKARRGFVEIEQLAIIDGRAKAFRRTQSTSSPSRMPYWENRTRETPLCLIRRRSTSAAKGRVSARSERRR